MTLKEYLRRNQITIEQFARDIDVCPETVRRYTKGMRFPSRFILARIAKRTDGKVKANDMLAATYSSVDADAAPEPVAAE